MCGIVGIVERDPSRPVAAADLAQMVRMLHHRGPDEEGSITLPGVALGMRRLAIVDLAGGQQPILNETGDIKIVANGEIYNFRELQRELEGLGHRFHSRNSDIEVLVHAYEQWGEDFLVRLRGMFALAIWDGRTARAKLKRVRQVPPAHFLMYRDGEAAVHRYWDAADVPIREWSDADAAAALSAALKTSVERQVTAHVPLGAFLSAGMKSSSIV